MISSNDRRAMRHKAGRRLRRLRVDKGIRTVEELSTELKERFGVELDSTLLHSMETGDAECGIDVWMILCELYGVELNKLAGGMELRNQNQG